MEKLFALYNIKTVGFIDNSNVARMYAYTNKMLANNIFIEYFTIDEMATEDDEEEIGKEDITDVDIDEEESDDENIEDDDLDDDEAVPEYGTRLSVIMKHKNKYYDLVMFQDTMEIGYPIMLLQTIIFLVKLIEESEPDQLVEYFKSIATNPLIPHEIPEKDFRNMANKMVKIKIQTIHNLIQEGKAGLN